MPGGQSAQDVQNKNIPVQKKEFIVPSYMHDDQSALQARIIQIRNNLPAMEDRIQELREKFSRDSEKRLPSYNEDSIFVGAEPYQIRDINMVDMKDAIEFSKRSRVALLVIGPVHTIVNDMVEKLMDDYIRKVPDGMDPLTADQLAWKTVQEADKVMKEVMMNRVTSLVMEQFVLEITLELSSEIAQEFHNVNQMSQSLAFDAIFNAVQEVGKQRQKQSENEKLTASPDHLITLLLEQQNDRELHRRGLWGHNLDIQDTHVASNNHLQQEKI
ncbi:uncharacterized protein [Heterodontus francisci]|uniref:uncharacterized protein n=1 Tax=Heterodontus francisci TaxID=7792 RepID=UPI00355B1DFC